MFLCVIRYLSALNISTWGVSVTFVEFIWFCIFYCLQYSEPAALHSCAFPLCPHQGAGTFAVCL